MYTIFKFLDIYIIYFQLNLMVFFLKKLLLLPIKKSYKPIKFFFLASKKLIYFLFFDKSISVHFTLLSTSTFKVDVDNRVLASTLGRH